MKLFGENKEYLTELDAAIKGRVSIRLEQGVGHLYLRYNVSSIKCDLSQKPHSVWLFWYANKD